MSVNVIRVPARSLKEQFSRGSDAWKEQSDPIFRFSTEGDDWWGFPFFSLTASRYFGDKETLCLYWPLGTVVITGPKVLDFYAGCAHGRHEWGDIHTWIAFLGIIPVMVHFVLNWQWLAKVAASKHIWRLAAGILSGLLIGVAFLLLPVERDERNGESDAIHLESEQ